MAWEDRLLSGTMDNVAANEFRGVSTVASLTAAAPVMTAEAVVGTEFACRW